MAKYEDVVEIVSPNERLLRARILGEDGRWTLQHTYAGKTYFELERRGAPSRWYTLRALRGLAWWDGAGARGRRRVKSA